MIELIENLPVYIAIFGIIVLLPSLYKYHKELQEDE
jgi:hypothetical protein